MTDRPVLDPATGEPIQSRPPIDPATGELIQSQGFSLPADTAGDAFKAGVHGNMLDMNPGSAYLNREAIDKQIRERSPNYDDGKIDPDIYDDVAVGIEGSIFGLFHRGQNPEQVRNPGMVDKFLTGLTETIADLPVYIAGGIGGAAAGGAAGSEVPVIGNIAGATVGGAVGGFGLPAYMRQVLTQQISKGNVTSFSDFLKRTASAINEGVKGAEVGVITEAVGGLPVGKLAGRSPIASRAIKGLYQATALTTAAGLMEGKVPDAKDFASNAALIIPLNLISRGVELTHPEAEQGTMGAYAKNGTTPAETANRLHAQPPVKEDLPQGLRPAIQTQEGFVDGDEGETHADVAERVLAKRPVSMEQLEADPAKADRVLENPAIHEQSVIDRAWEIKSEAIDAGEVEAPKEGEKPLTIDDLYDRNAMKSGRGFVTPDGKFLSRMEARKWMKDNEPEVHEAWLEDQNGDKQAELHSEAYGIARMRVQARSLAEGDPQISQLSPQNTSRLAAARAGLNKIKAGLESAKYGREVIRTLFAGQRDARIAATTQLRDSLKKIIPDYRDQEALSILRDYKGDEARLASDLEEIRNGDNERLKALIPSIERAINPSPALLEADRLMTDYYTKAQQEGKEFGISGIADSGIDPANYSPHLFTQILDGEAQERGTGKAVMTQTTPFGKERKYRTILDAMKTEKIDARTINALDALSIYGDRHATVVATKILAAELRNTEMGKYGTADKHPAGWVPIAPGQGAFRSTRIIEDNTGESHIVSQDLYVPKEVAKAVKPLFNQGLRDTEFAPLLKVQGYVKGLELGLSFFHVKALNITAMNNMSFMNYMKSMFTDTKAPDFQAEQREWAADGLVTAQSQTPYEAYEGLRKSSIPDETKGIISKGFSVIKDSAAVEKVDAAFKAITKYTFEIVQTKWKVQDASLRAASWMADHPNATNEEIFAARRSIAKEVNSAYGGLNWDVLGRSKTFRDVSRLVMLAPDWTFSNVLTTKYAFEGGPAGDAARMFWLKSTMTGFAMTAAMSIAIGGKYDPTDLKHFHQVYLGKDEKGKEMYADLFFAGAPKDALTLMRRVISDSPIEGTAEFVVSKASPVAGVIVGLSANKQPTGAPISKKPGTIKPSGEEYTRVDQAKDQAEFVAGRVAPITGVSAVQTVVNALSDPNHEYSYKDLLELAADSLGAQTIHSAPAKGTGATSTTNRFQQKGRTAPKNRFSIKGRK